VAHIAAFVLNFQKKIMKRTFTITTIKTVTVDVADESLTPDSVKEFSDAIYPIAGPDSLLEHAATMVAIHGDHFVEGVGRATSIASVGTEDGGRCPIEFVVDHVDVECSWDKSKHGEKLQSDLTCQD
jgi:hypothetical protein